MSSVKIQNDKAIAYLTDNLTDKQAGIDCLILLMKDLGNSVVTYPAWHPVLTATFGSDKKTRYYTKQYKREVLSYIDDPTMSALFAGGYIVFAKTQQQANEMVEIIRSIPDGLYAYVLEDPLLTDSSFPVVVECESVDSETSEISSVDSEQTVGYGTVHWRSALVCFSQLLVDKARDGCIRKPVWEDLEEQFLGVPSNSCVNQTTKQKMLTIMNAMKETKMLGV